MNRPSWLAWARVPRLNPSTRARMRRVVVFAVICLLVAGTFAIALVYTRGKVDCLQNQLKARNHPTAEQAQADRSLGTAAAKYFISNVTYIQAQASDAAALTAVLVAPKDKQLELFKAFTRIQRTYTRATTTEATAAQAMADAENAWKDTLARIQAERAAHPLGDC